MEFECEIIRYYQYKDHLGNVRLSFYKNSAGVATILDENNYYSFGLEHLGYNTLAGNPSYRYTYNGKELQDDSGMVDYGARMYIPELGRWGLVEPMAEMMRRFSPYVYGNNNPIMFIDPDGRLSKEYNAGETYTGQDAIDLLNFFQERSASARFDEKGPTYRTNSIGGAGGGGDDGKNWFGRAWDTVKGWFSRDKNSGTLDVGVPEGEVIDDNGYSIWGFIADFTGGSLDVNIHLDAKSLSTNSDETTNWA